MNSPCQPGPGVPGVFKSSFSCELVGGRPRHCRQPRRWPVTSTTQDMIHLLVKRTQPLVLRKERENKKRGCWGRYGRMRQRQKRFWNMNQQHEILESDLSIKRAGVCVVGLYWSLLQLHVLTLYWPINVMGTLAPRICISKEPVSKKSRILTM